MKAIGNIFSIVALSFCIFTSRAGLHPFNTLVVVNDNSSDSQALGHYYQQQYTIPEANICHITVDTNYNISTAAFSNQVRNPILNYIQTQELTNQVTTIVFSRDIPYRVYDTNNPSFDINSITAAMFYDYKQSPEWCSLPSNTTSAYFAAETAFEKETFPSNYLCMMLTSWELDDSLALIDRSMRANRSSPTGTVQLLHTTDTARNVEWQQFDTTDYLCRFLSIPQQRLIKDEQTLFNQTNVSGCTIGRRYITNDIYSNIFTPGAIGNNLTSAGGYLFDSDLQMSLLHWLKAGCAASYGTCIEPCNYTNKFPNMEVYYWYGRGFSAGESYYMSIHNPYQGVFGGDPLCAPYAKSALIEIQNIPETCTNNLAITVHTTAADRTRPLDQICLYIDGVYTRTITNIPPSPGNTIDITINGTTRSTTVQSGDNLADVANRVRNRVNSPGTLGVTANGRSDRATLSENTIGVSSAGKTCEASTAIGSAGECTTFAYVPHTNFLETAYPARQLINLYGTPVAGDMVTTIIENLDFNSYTNSVTAIGGETCAQLLARLMAAINSNTSLGNTRGCIAKYQRSSGTYSECFLIARTNTWEAASLSLSFQLNLQPGSSLSDTSYTGSFLSNLNDQRNQTVIFMSCGRTNITATADIDTTQLADGPHLLTIIAREGTAVGTLTSHSEPITIRNTEISCTITNPVSMANLSTGTTFNVFATSSNTATTITGLQLTAEGKVVAQTNSPSGTFTLDSDSYGPGIIHLQAEALAQDGTSALSNPIEIRIYQDTDHDGIPSWWEYEYFEGSTNATPTADPDNDTADNLSEYIALTTPTDGSNVFETGLSLFNTTNVLIQFTSNTQRFYNIYQRDELTNGSWSSSYPTFRGWQNTTLWTNLSTNTHQYYRVESIIP